MITVEQLLMTAKEQGASDVHITVGVPPKMRVNGELLDLDYPRLMPDDCEKIVLSIMNERQLAMFKENGELDFSFSIPQVGRYRVNVFRQRGSVACAMRIVGTEVPKPEQLGVPQSVIDLYDKKRGLVLVTGPTGSGKSTTLASLIDRINDERNAHVITLEDPIEYLHSHRKSMINQREIIDFLCECRYSIGSSNVMTCAFLSSFILSISEANVVDLPLPVGPVTSTSPLFLS